MTAAQGFAAQLGIDTANPVTKMYEFLTENLALSEEFVPSDGIRGIRSNPKEAVRQGVRRVGGTISMRPNPVQLAALLPHILGANASGTTYALGDSFTDLYVTVDRVTKVFTYDGCVVNRAVFRSSAGQPLTMDLELLGKDETIGNAGSFPSLSIDITTSFFMFGDLVLSIGGSEYSASDFELVIDNARDGERIFNAQVRASIPPTNRNVLFNTNLPYGDAAAAYATGVAGVAVTATFTNGTTSLVFTMPAVQFPRQSPTVPGKSEIMLPLAGVARKSSSTNELTITLDSTP